jgi:molybdopterin synthase catalytic subunit
MDAVTPVWVSTDPDQRWTVSLDVHPLSVADAAQWVTQAGCGAIVTFSGTTRDHSVAPDGSGRTGVQRLEYEAYEQPAVDRMARIANAVWARWPDTGRVWIAHRLGGVDTSQTSVVVAVSAPHRGEAFAAARFAIDQVKATVPIWKREYWHDGQAWASDATDIAEIDIAGAADGGESPGRRGNLGVAAAASGPAGAVGFDSSPVMADTGVPGRAAFVSDPSSSEDSGWAI